MCYGVATPAFKSIVPRALPNSTQIQILYTYVLYRADVSASWMQSEDYSDSEDGKLGLGDSVLHCAYHCTNSLFLAAVLLAPVVSLANAENQEDRHSTVVQVRYYDRDHRDFHYWDDREDRAYRRYLVEQHRAYLKFERADISVHRHYWNWRHSHPDND
jgi:hypothetical protein